jgi:hypothetical protein
MSSLRLWTVNALILGLLGASLETLATDQEHWPFSTYAMFSETRRAPELSTLELWGRPAGSDGNEVPVDRPEELTPMDADRLAASLSRLVAAGRSNDDLAAALRDCLERSNRYREGHGEPMLAQLRLYQVHRKIRIASAGPDTVDVRRLVAAVEAPPGP